ncbi:MAG: glycosyltransferase family 2 protein [Candidatus Bathyarchaeia archaeon]
MPSEMESGKQVYPKVSVFIPVYRGSDFLDELLWELTCSGYENKEIFVAIDEPDERSFRAVEKYSGKVHFMISQFRRGKVEALNSAVEASSGEILVFLDADVSLRGEGFLECIVEEMRDADILDFRKGIINESFISRMVNYEFISANLVSYLYSRLVGKCVGINGAAFAIRRSVFEEVGGFSRVISEDFDLALKVLMRNGRFKYSERLEAHTRAPSCWRGWIKQRKRWSVGAGLWIKENWRRFLTCVADYPHIALPSLIILFPVLTPLILNYALMNAPGYNVPNILPSFITVQSGLWIPVTPYTAQLISKALLALFISFLPFAAIFYAASKKLRLRFKIHEFLIYFFIYQPISTLVLVGGIITAFLFEKHNLDWKV